jgi:hypothetical protein
MSLSSYWKIRYSIISGTFRTIEVVAFNYEDSRKVFENKTGLPKSHILTSTQVK